MRKLTFRKCCSFRVLKVFCQLVMWLLEVYIFNLDFPILYVLHGNKELILSKEEEKIFKNFPWGKQACMDVGRQGPVWLGVGGLVKLTCLEAKFKRISVFAQFFSSPLILEPRLIPHFLAETLTLQCSIWIANKNYCLILKDLKNTPCICALVLQSNKTSRRWNSILPKLSPLVQNHPTPRGEREWLFGFWE